MKLYTKTEAAFLLSFDTLVEAAHDLYFWTFTAEYPESDDRFAKAFHTFWHRVDKAWNSATFQGLRVFERHEGDGERSGFMHAHMCCNERLPAKMLWRLAEGTGIGRIDVRKVEEDAKEITGRYLAKYLTKAEAGFGVRRWAKLGWWDHTTVGRVKVHSEEADEFRAVYQDLRGNPRAYMLAKVVIAQRRAEARGVAHVRSQRIDPDLRAALMGWPLPEVVL